MGESLFVIATTTDLEACLRIRRQVFVLEQQVPEDLEVDGLDPQCVHFLALSGDQPVGTARLLAGEGYAKIQRVAVLRCARGQGLGAALIRAMVDHVRTQNTAPRIVLGAQTHALQFYQKLGFTAFGSVYLDAGIQHRDMDMQISCAPE